MEQNGRIYLRILGVQPPDKENFCRRNRIVAGMASGNYRHRVCRTGGSLITAQIAKWL